MHYLYNLRYSESVEYMIFCQNMICIVILHIGFYGEDYGLTFRIQGIRYKHI